jgi:hypothetical protein
MRIGAELKRSLLLAVLTAVLAGSAMLGWASRVESPRDTGAAVLRSPVVATDRTMGGLRLDADTRKSLGTFRLSTGRNIELVAARASDGQSCVIDEDERGAIGGTCLADGLFGARRAAFYVSSQGGPQRFDELYVAGVVAPSVHGMVLVKTDGNTVRLDLNPSRAFVFESPGADLEAGIYPTELRLYGPSGKLIETVAFPPAG